MSPEFGRVLTAMVTPFDDNGELDLGAAEELANFLVETGSDGLVLAGTTGESPTLTESEELVLFRTVRAAVKVPLLAGAGSNSTASAVSMTRQASTTGVDGILSVAPYYNRPPQAGLDAHFRAIAAATELPVIIYDIPIRTGRKVATDTLVRLANEVPNIVGLKDAAGDAPETARLMSRVDDDFVLYSGDDAMTLPLLAVGAVGVIAVASHWAARQMGEMIDAFGKGDVTTARAINESLIPSYAYETSEAAPNPIPTKTLLRVLGLRVGECRPPLGPAPDDLADAARAVLDGLG
jgi:4-hydroxy-tetrahydrodipicolinate synthase